MYFCTFHRQLHEKCQVLMRKYDRESRANKRISMDYEQCMWRMTQSSEFGSNESLTKPQYNRSSSSHGREELLDGRSTSPAGGHGDVVHRVRKRTSHNINNSDRKLRSKSANFLNEKNENSDSGSPSPSAELKQKKQNKKCHGKGTVAGSEKPERMVHSAGPEVLIRILSEPSGHQKHFSEQNENTISKDLTESQVTSVSNMSSSYARSLSGISDSGVYDSLTRSDQLNSSIDSEWGTSVNMLITSDSKLGDRSSGPAAGDYHFAE
uniref:Uncharacterized protein n=1 Tax=Arion vulgaris TaxID=1028688 RepID=A0A0B7B4G2_9EUPU